MQIALHMGAHCTDEDSLLRSLLQNKATLAGQGIAVPGPGRYRRNMVQAARKLKGRAANRETQNLLLDAMLDDDSARRVVLSFEHFICVPGRVFDGALLYEKAGHKPGWFRNLFPDHEAEIFLAVRNPATFVPAVLAHPDQSHKSAEALLQGCEVRDMRWSDVALAIRECCPDAPLTVWCNEDTPLIWPEVMARLTGHDPATQLSGGLAVVRQIMQPEGIGRLEAYLQEHPPADEDQRRRTVSAFLEKYVIEDAVEEVVEMPGWTDDLVGLLTETYDEDLAELASIPGVTLVTA